MQKTMVLLQRLLLITVLSISIGQVGAQTTTTDFEQALSQAGWNVHRDNEGSLVLKPRVITKTSDKWQQFQNALDAAGWTTSREADGSLVLFPKQKVSAASQNDLNKKPEMTPYQDLSSLQKQLFESGWNVERDSLGNLILIPERPTKATQKNPIDQWQQLQKKLNATGWRTQREADGTLLLKPKPIVTQSPEVTSSQTKTDEHLSLREMQQKLRDTGWKVSDKPDGSILLYPPGKSPDKTIQSSPGIFTKVNIALPVNSWQKAHKIAGAWLKNQADVKMSVGKIRKVLKTYVVSIVSKKAPYNLQHQIAIRGHDGAVIVLN